MNERDLIIIGCGPGGFDTARLAAKQGLRVTVVERDLVGGTCLNRGCIPTKTLLASARAMHSAMRSAALGIVTEAPAVDYRAVAERVQSVVTTLRSGAENTLQGVAKLVHGDARLLPGEPLAVKVGDTIYTAPRVIIATGSAPAVLPVPGADLAMTSDGLLQLRELPASIAIIGGGVIGMEFADILHTLGADVTVVEYCKEILPGFDKDVAKRLRALLTRRGIKIITGAAVTALHDAPDGSVTVTFTAKGKETDVTAHAALMAVGRRPVTPAGLADAGVELTPRGAVKVDNDLRTTRPGVYAIGDCNALCMLAHAASAQGEKVLGEPVDLHAMPADLFTTPEAAMVGLTEEECARREIPCRVHKALFATNSKALAMGETDGFVKLLSHAETGEVLGAHILGAEASSLIVEPALAVARRLPLSAIAHTIHAHPTLSETLRAAALA